MQNNSQFRFHLFRRFSDGETLAWIMLNPSTADDNVDDPTIRRCMGFAKRAGYGSIVVANLCPVRATKPADLLSSIRELETPEMWRHNRKILNQIAMFDVVLAWGAHAPRIARKNSSFASERLFSINLPTDNCGNIWPASTAYLLGDRVESDSGNQYFCSTAGKSAEYITLAKPRRLYIARTRSGEPAHPLMKPYGPLKIWNAGT